MDCPKLKLDIVTKNGSIHDSEKVDTWKGLQEAYREAVEFLETGSFTESWEIRVKLR